MSAVCLTHQPTGSITGHSCSKLSCSRDTNPAMHQSVRSSKKCELRSHDFFAFLVGPLEVSPFADTMIGG
ncbi:uncharacterized protein METZ01_LOCUS333922 [marine metagenome]|uniref:Uncharacterized protein n=1 Tax=marine metagenome TaxID=408172 RepID=A0A382Q808_9ZZZZ